METAGEKEINRRRTGDSESHKSAEETGRKQIFLSYLAPKPGKKILTFTHLSSTSGPLESVINSTVLAEGFTRGVGVGGLPK